MSQLREAIEKNGGMSCVAARLGVSAQRLSNWADRGVPIEKCASVEKALHSMVTRRDMRPQDWREIWPELAANEASVDVASPVVAVAEPGCADC